MPGCYVFCRFWPVFTNRFSIQKVNHLSDEALWPELMRLADSWLRSAPPISDQDRARLAACDALLAKGAEAGAPAPPYHEFVHVRSGDGWRLETGVFEDKANRGHVYLVAPALWPELLGEVVPVCLFLAVNRQGDPFLWPCKLPGADRR